MNKKSCVLIPLAKGCEEMEAVIIIDLLRRADMDVTTASLTEEPVICSRKTVIIADTYLDNVMEQSFDLLVLPGGLPGADNLNADNLNADERIHQLINRFASENKIVAAICAAPKVLLNNGILAGKRVAAYPNSLSQLDTSSVQLSDEAIEVDGKVITSRGPGTAMDFSLCLIETLLGKEARKEVEEPLVRG